MLCPSNGELTSVFTKKKMNYNSCAHFVEWGGMNVCKDWATLHGPAENCHKIHLIQLICSPCMHSAEPHIPTPPPSPSCASRNCGFLALLHCMPAAVFPSQCCYFWDTCGSNYSKQLVYQIQNIEI